MDVKRKHLIWLIAICLALQWICFVLQISTEKENSDRITENTRTLLRLDLLKMGNSKYTGNKKFGNKSSTSYEYVELNKLVDNNNNLIRLIENYSQNETIPQWSIKNKQKLSRHDGNNVCFRCQSFDFHTLLKSNRCGLTNTNLQIFVLITSRPSNWVQRMTLRQSYLSGLNNTLVDYVFILGKSIDETTEAKVNRESSVFQDIVKFDFIDSYKNLTLKSISGFKWTAEYCKEARYILKIDDDVWVNIESLLRDSFSPSFIKYIGGYCFNNAIPIREPKYKHFIAKKEYPEEMFPPYCNGPAYVITMPVIKDIIAVAPSIPFVHIEDVFVGICLKRLNYTVSHNDKFRKFDVYRHPCYYKSDAIYTFHHLPPSLISRVWNSKCKPWRDYSEVYVDINMIEGINLTDFSQRKLCRNCFHVNHSVIIENNVCHVDKNSNIKVFLLIFTKPSHFQNRLAIRQTYLTPFQRPNSTMRYVFVMGFDKNSLINEIVEWENNYFGDILMFKFQDSYFNLTIKTINILKWVTTKCSNTKYIVKIDDDVWLNAEALLSSLNTKQMFQNIGGECRPKSRPIYYRQSKYYNEPKIYPHFNFPPFCAGPSYIMTTHVAKDIVRVSPNVPFFRLEDVYIGFCLYYLNYKVSFIPTFLPSMEFPRICRLKSDFVHTFHKVSPNFMKQIWQVKC